MCDQKKELSGKSFLSDEEKFLELFSVKNLKTTWKKIRREIRGHRFRDTIDWMDWAISIDSTLKNVHNTLIRGDYKPSYPWRYEMAKTNGAFRILTVPNIKDALIYRLICDRVLELALPHKVAGAYFSRRLTPTPVGKTFNTYDDPYSRFFEVWLRYNQYRTRTLLNSPYEVLVVTDITNYFDSIPHDLLLEYLAPFGLPRKAVGVLGQLLEVLKPCAGHSPNPRIGIPVDEFDCSRELAHIFLFEHDRRMTEDFGEENYVRWMDDQNIGAKNQQEARRIVNCLTRSLSSQRLTLNAGKTKFYSSDDVIVMFQLDANKMIDDWEKKYKILKQNNLEHAREDLSNIWDNLSNGSTNGKGNWEKVLKRLYACASKVNSNILDERTYDDLIRYPDLDERIFTSLALRNEGQLLLDLFGKYAEEGESLFEATEAAFFNSCLLLDAGKATEIAIVDLSKRFLDGKNDYFTKKPYGKASALLCIYWFSEYEIDYDGQFSANEAPILPSVVARSWLAVTAARMPNTLKKVQSKLIGHPSDDVARMSHFLDGILSGTINSVGNYKKQKPRWPLKGKYYDARAWLQFEIFSQTESGNLKSKIKSDMRHFNNQAHTVQERRVLARVRTRLT